MSYIKQYKMNLFNLREKYAIPEILTYFVVAAPFVNLVALFSTNQPGLFFIAQAFAFVYMLVTPGLFTLPLLTSKKLPFGLGIALSVSLSVFLLMLVGLFVNTILPLVGISAPLTTLPLLIAFDVLIISLFSLNAIYKKDFALEPLKLNKFSKYLVIGTMFLPVLVFLGSIMLNNGGSNIPSMAVLGLIFLLVPLVIWKEKDVDEDALPILLYIISLSLLLMNSLRGWFVTGHDILLEQHVFVLTNTNHLWSMEAFRDPYNACLSLTILPTFIQNLIHISNNYVFKFLFQFIGAFPVVVIYYLTRKYSHAMVAFLAGFMFISFPSYIVDMAFLNRQGLAFLFFSAIVFTAFNPDYFRKHTKIILMFMFGIGMVFSHYSTSYIAVALFIGTYIANKLIRLVVNLNRPKWLSKITSRFSNREMFKMPILISLPFVIGMMLCMLFWSVVITKTSSTFISTIKEIAVNIKHPFGIDDYWGPAKYSLFNSKEVSPQELFDQYLKDTIEKTKQVDGENLYPEEVAEKYLSFPIYPVNEPLIPITGVGSFIQNNLHINLMDFFNLIKQMYAKIIQVFLLIGFIGLAVGYGFKKNIIQHVPSEFIALSIAGIGIMVAQTVLPANAIEYGLLRLFQQNLIFLSLPIICGILAVVSLFIGSRFRYLVASSIMLAFYLVLSGFLPQITGGGRPALPLNNFGFYYDTYYTHAEEIRSIEWMAKNYSKKYQIQSDHYFSNVKILTYAHIGTDTGLLSQTIKKDSYIYLNYNNVKSSSVIEFLNGDVFYYHFPTTFLRDNKNLIYNNGGSEIYK